MLFMCFASKSFLSCCTRQMRNRTQNMHAASNSPKAQREWLRLIWYKTLKVRWKRILRIKINHNNSEHGEFLDFVKLTAFWVPCMSTMMPCMCNNWQSGGDAVQSGKMTKVASGARESRVLGHYDGDSYKLLGPNSNMGWWSRKRAQSHEGIQRKDEVGRN